MMWPETANIADAPALRLQEGIMAKQEFHWSIDRRRLLATAAAITAASAVPSVKRPDAADLEFSQSSAPTPKTETPNFSAATARRLVEIVRRNEIRQEAKLPPLSISRELRRLMEQEKLEEFERFAVVHRKAVLDQVLKPRIEAGSKPEVPSISR
jgi:hypothetical protein